MADDSTLKVFEKYPGSWRLDHPDFGHVSKTIYAKGVITAFYEASGDDPMVVKDVCDLEVDGQAYQEVPIFYHPPKAYIDNWKLNTEPSIHPYGILLPDYVIPLPDDEAWTEFWENAGALIDKEGKVVTQESIPQEGISFDGHTIARGAYAFSVGDEVTVMLQEGQPIAVTGFADGIPRRPFDYAQIEMPPQVLDSDFPDIIGDPECPYVIQLSDSLKVPNWLGQGEKATGPDGFDLKLLKDAQVFPDKVKHNSDSYDNELVFDLNYYCFYEGMENIDISLFVALYDPAHWNPVPDPGFGPFCGYMHYMAIWCVDIPDWTTYLEDRWKITCDIIQQQEYVEGSWQDKPYVGLWPSRDGETSLGRPLYWAITVWDGGHAEISEDFVMRTYLLEAGPILYLVRVFYYHAVLNSTGISINLWKDRIVWPWTSVPPSGWAGYAPGDEINYTWPIWRDPDFHNPVPTQLSECNPPPDEVLPVEDYRNEVFYTNNPQFIYVAPSSKEILDNIENIVAASNAGVDVQAVQQGWSYDSAQPPEGFRGLFGPGVSYEHPPGFLPAVGNYRELNFKIANKEQSYG
jgi:hypothetical protein